MARFLAIILTACLVGGDACAERWLIERGPTPADLAADLAALPGAAEILARRDLAELKGVALVSKADVKSDILTLELNRLASAKAEDRVLLGLFARARGLIVIDIAAGATPSVRLTAVDLTQKEREKEFTAPLAAKDLEASVAGLVASAAEFLGRKPADAELARMSRSQGLTPEGLDAMGGLPDAKDAAARGLLARRAAELAPQSALAKYLLARELHADGRLAEAISAYRDANRLDDAQPLYHYDLANAFFDDKRYDEAIAEYERAIALDPSHAESHENFLRAHAAKGEAADVVLGAYRKLVTAYPDLALAHLNVGGLLARAGKLDEATAEYHKACDLAPADPIVRFDLAHVLEQAGKDNEAFYEYKEAVRLAPNYAKAHNNLGRLYESKGKDKLALYYYLQAVKYAPDYALAWSNLGILYGKRGPDREPQPELAIAAFRKQAKLTPDDAVAHFNLAVALQKSGDVAGAIERLKRALDLAPNDKAAHWQLAFAYEHEHFANLAAEHWRKVLSLNPTPEEKATADKRLADLAGK